jgi:hypothetical protein
MYSLAKLSSITPDILHLPWAAHIDIERQKIDCLRFVMCPLLALGFQGFFFSFLIRLLTALMKQTRQVGRAIKKSIYLDVYGGAA